MRLCANHIGCETDFCERILKEALNLEVIENKVQLKDKEPNLEKNEEELTLKDTTTLPINIAKGYENVTVQFNSGKTISLTVEELEDLQKYTEEYAIERLKSFLPDSLFNQVMEWKESFYTKAPFYTIAINTTSKRIVICRHMQDNNDKTLFRYVSLEDAAAEAEELQSVYPSYIIEYEVKDI